MVLFGVWSDGVMVGGAFVTLSSSFYKWRLQMAWNTLLL